MHDMLDIKQSMSRQPKSKWYNYDDDGRIMLKKQVYKFSEKTKRIVSSKRSWIMVELCRIESEGPKIMFL